MCERCDQLFASFVESERFLQIAKEAVDIAKSVDGDDGTIRLGARYLFHAFYPTLMLTGDVEQAYRKCDIALAEMRSYAELARHQDAGGALN